MIWFNCQKAREVLLKNGIVVTARKRRKTFGKHKAYYNSNKKKVEFALVNVELLENSILDDDNYNHEKVLSNYVHLSGFDTVKEWVKEICKLNNNRWIPTYLVLLKVMIID